MSLDRPNLSKKMQDLKDRIDDLVSQELELRKKLRALVSKCQHVIVGEKDESAECLVCGATFGWWCPDSPDHFCHYDKGDFDQCDFCGDPEERK